MSTEYPVIDFNQFGSDTEYDRLLLFAAKAKDLAAWAGIPRKGWRIRMLFQRWITEGRERELKDFWRRASTRDEESGQDFVMGPSAIVLAIQGDPTVEDGKIKLDYESPLDEIGSEAEMLKVLSNLVRPKIVERLSDESRAIAEEFHEDPIVDELPDSGHDYVLEFCFQLSQMDKNPEWFIEHNEIDQEGELPDLITSMESLCRPAIVVDGQHRLWGAQAVDADVYLPVVALTKSDWMDQIYQFVVINEKAQKVQSELLNDIFASSLTPEEQDRMRSNFVRVKVDIEQRIAGVLAGRNPESPFKHMVTLDLPNPPESEASAYISQNIIQNLIEGGRGSWGWRSDDSFYNEYVKATYPNRDEWEDWRKGKWQEYWFAFWSTVRDVYRSKAKSIKGEEFDIWSEEIQSNLTKGVGLKIFQKFFMETRIDEIRSEKRLLDVLKEHMGEEEAERAIASKVKEKSIPSSLDDFCDRVRDGFLADFPVRFFTANWESSLDDTTGQDNLLYQMREAYSRDNWRARGGGVFVPSSE